MPAITLPDGSQRKYEAPVTVMDVAADIGPGLAKATLAGEVDGQSARCQPPDRRRRGAAHHYRQGPGGAGGHPPLDRAPAGAGGGAAVPGMPGHHRPGHRERLLLRLLLSARFHDGRPRPHRRRDAPHRQGCAAGDARSLASRRGHPVLPPGGRGIQGARSSRTCRKARRSRSTARASSSTCAAVRTCRIPASWASSS